MEAFQERLARIALAAAGHDFALAGGHAVAVHGLVDRPTEDLDLFTTPDGDVEAGVEAVVRAFADGGLSVSVDTVTSTPDFARLRVSDDSGNRSQVELCRDYRRHPAVMLDVGLVLHPDDAVASKMAALWSRAEARDFVDVNAALARYSPDDLVRLVAERDPGFDENYFAVALAQCGRLPDAAFAALGLTAEEITKLRERFARWREALGAQ